MNIIERHLPQKCYGQRSYDDSPLITPEGIVIHYISDRYLNYGDDPYSVDQIVQILIDYQLSYHYLIDREGNVISLVPLPYRAFHAGKSEWSGRNDCNDWMIGIALVGMDGDNFTHEQYKALAILCARTITRWKKIRRQNIVGHEHVAPDRKVDPGPLFEWRELRSAISGLFVP